MIPHQRYTAAYQTLESVSQTHALHYYDQLDDSEQNNLLSQIENIDWPLVDQLIQTHIKHPAPPSLPSKIEPAPWYPSTPTAPLQAKYDQARTIGQQLITDGKVAAFTVAGGQGTRLGWPKPKGTFPATPIQKLPLFAVMAQFIQKTQLKYATTCPWYIMTSPANHDDTKAFFQQNHYFDLDPANIRFFPQEMLPAIDPSTAKVLLQSRSSLALSPNGHGGSLKALATSGALDDMHQRGIEQISYTQIDNPLVKVVDPLFLGLHAIDHCQMSSKMVPKTGPDEKLGNFCTVDGQLKVIEYSDLPQHLAQQRNPAGQLRFLAGSIAIHAIRVGFVQSMNQQSQFALKFHVAQKKVPYIDLQTDHLVEPQSPNAVKFETFIFDALDQCTHSILYETDRTQEFAPIKNAKGVDSPQSSSQLQIERAARWLESKNVTIPRDDTGRTTATIELTQLTAIEPDDLDHVDLPNTIQPGTQLVL